MTGEPKRCWSTPQLAVSEDFGGGEYEGVDELLSISSNTTDSYPDVVLEECTGLCVIEAAYSIDARSGLFKHHQLKSRLYMYVVKLKIRTISISLLCIFACH